MNGRIARRFLVVGAKALARDLLALRLKRLGFKVATAEGLAAARELVRAEAFAAIFVDPWPGAGGAPDLGELARAAGGGARMVLLAESAGEGAGPLPAPGTEGGLPAGADAVLAYPFEEMAVRKVLELVDTPRDQGEEATWSR